MALYAVKLEWQIVLFLLLKQSQFCGTPSDNIKAIQIKYTTLKD